MVAFWIVIVILLFILATGVRVINQYERGVVFRLGRVQGSAVRFGRLRPLGRPFRSSEELHHGPSPRTGDHPYR